MHMVGLNLGFWQTWFVLSIRTLLLTIPIQGIAGIGTGQAWWAGALSSKASPPSWPSSAGLTLQAIDLAVSLPVAGLGSTLLFRRREAGRAREPAGGRRGDAHADDARAHPRRLNQPHSAHAPLREA